MTSYVCRLADHNPRTVVDTEVLADRGAGVNVDPGFAVRMLGNDPRYVGYTQLEQLIGNPVRRNSIESRIRPDDLILRPRRRVTFEHGGRIVDQHAVDFG